MKHFGNLQKERCGRILKAFLLLIKKDTREATLEDNKVE